MKNAKSFGELFVTHVENFTEYWHDGGSRSQKPVGFWQPNIPDNYRALGTVAIPGWGSKNLPHAGVHVVDEHVVAICVRQNPTVPAARPEPSLADPVDYELVWDDKGSGARYKCSLWRPIPPEGYVAMGLAASDDSYDKPPLNAVACVREDLTHRAVASDEPVFTGQGLGTKHDVSVWRNNAPPKYVDSPDSSHVLIAPNTYVAHTSTDQPKHLPEMRVLCLPVPSDKNVRPAQPELEGRTSPAGMTPELLTNAAWLPFEAVKDDERSTEWKLANSPFYRVERRASWTLLKFFNNTTDAAQNVGTTVTTGVEEEEAQAFSVNTGFSYAGTGGFSIGVVTASVTTTLSLDLGFSRSRSTKKLETRADNVSINVPANHAGALWVATNSLQVVRGDGTLVSEPLVFYSFDNFHADQFPDNPEHTNVTTTGGAPTQVGIIKKPGTAGKATAGAGASKRSTKA